MILGVSRYNKVVTLSAASHMFAKDLRIQDLDRIGPIVETLLQSERLTDDEKWAVDLAGRAAFDLAQIRHSEIARAFYARSDMEERSANSISE